MVKCSTKVTPTPKTPDSRRRLLSRLVDTEDWGVLPSDTTLLPKHYKDQVKESWTNLLLIPSYLRACLCQLALTHEYPSSVGREQWKALEYIPRGSISPDLADLALYSKKRFNWEALMYIPGVSQTEEMCLDAVKACTSAVYYIAPGNVTPGIIGIVSERYGKDIESIYDLEIMEELVTSGLLQREVAEWFIRRRWKEITLGEERLSVAMSLVNRGSNSAREDTVKFMGKKVVLGQNLVR